MEPGKSIYEEDIQKSLMVSNKTTKTPKKNPKRKASEVSQSSSESDHEHTLPLNLRSNRHILIFGVS